MGRDADTDLGLEHTNTALGVRYESPKGPQQSFGSLTIYTRDRPPCCSGPPQNQLAFISPGSGHSCSGRGGLTPLPRPLVTAKYQTFTHMWAYLRARKWRGKRY